jgi:hypothetical protein
MKFYEIDNALQEAIAAADKPVRVRVQIGLPYGFESVFEQDIVEADFYGLKEVSGGTSARGEILLENPDGAYSYTATGPGTKVKVLFSLGEGLPFFERFIFFMEFDFGDSGKTAFFAVQIENEGKKGPWGPLVSALIP